MALTLPGARIGTDLLEIVEKRPDLLEKQKKEGVVDALAVARAGGVTDQRTAKPPRQRRARMPTRGELEARRRKGREHIKRTIGAGRRNLLRPDGRQSRTVREGHWSVWICEIMWRADPDAWWSSTEVRAWSARFGRRMRTQYARTFLLLCLKHGMVSRRVLGDGQRHMGEVLYLYRLEPRGVLTAILSRSAMRSPDGRVVWIDRPRGRPKGAKDKKPRRKRRGDRYLDRPGRG